MGDRLNAFVVGATGQVGKAVAKELAKCKAYGKVDLLVRRQIDVSQGDTENDYGKFKVKVVNFDNLSTDHAKDFEGHDVGFCVLGATGTEEDIIRVEHDYAVETAKLAKAGGCKHFNLLTGMLADEHSAVFALRNKGRIEADVTAIGFERLSIWRTYQLVGGKRNSQSVLSSVLGPIDCFRFISCEVSVLAKVMLNHSLKPVENPVEIIENGEIRRMGGEIIK